MPIRFPFNLIQALTLAAALLLAALPLRAQDLKPAEKVVLQLKWKHQFQFAGYYAALKKGYYRDAGFVVDIRELQDGVDPVDSVLKGEADFGVGASELVLHRAQGKPVVVLAVILQHSPLVLITLGGGLKSLHDLDGKRVMLLPQETELYAYLEREKLPRKRIIEVKHSFDVEALIRGRVDALSGYSTDEPFALKQRGLPYTLFSPRASGIDFYGDTLFTSEALVKRDPRRVIAFREASLRGWQYAMDHPEEIADLILERYGRRHSREHLLFEAAEMRRLMQPHLIRIGHINPGRWRGIAAVYAENGMLPAQHSLDGFIFDETMPRDLSRLYRGIAAALLIAVLVLLFAWRQAVFNRRLRSEVARRREAEATLRDANQKLQAQLAEIQGLQARLQDQALRDSLTGLYNRRYFDEALERELALAQRQDYPVSLVLIDIDHFKQLNDAHGHQAGDAVLQEMARHLTENCRAGDLVCRWGGEEFVVVMPHTPLAGALQRAESWRAGFGAHPFRFGGITLNNTLSAGVAVWPEHGGTEDELLRAADAALYRAKSGGRNRVETAARVKEAAC
ncbi:MAG: diguanylate cyclase [Burkholderiales bacterium]|jgi:diguanylate cyclase (GGDEF)-like protein|nr:diguanylate cyclase [Burkholderiales bacterium]